MTSWNRIDRGTGRPLVLLHGGGSSARSWLPVIDLLAAHRRVIAFDIPGFGRTPALTGELTMAVFVRELGAELGRLGIAAPVDMAGNSMGGWMALEAARHGLASSVVGIGPAGLWNPGMPVRTRMQFFAGFAGAWLVRTPARALLRYPAVRIALLSAPLRHPERLTAAEAIGIVDDLYRSIPTLSRALRVAFHARFEGGHRLSIPITLAFGSDDRMVRPADSRFLDQLPAHTRVLTLPDCGHMPMWEDPELVARTILEGIEISSETGELGA